MVALTLPVVHDPRKDLLVEVLGRLEKYLIKSAGAMLATGISGDHDILRSNLIKHTFVQLYLLPYHKLLGVFGELTCW